MLGEAAATAEDAQRYYVAYEHAIHAIGKASARRGIHEGPGELGPKLRALTLLAREYDIGLNIDAEEADRLDLSLDLLESLCFDAALDGWNGIGFVVQAYQKRAPFVLDYLIDLASRSRHRLMVRLVKGAYWDTEIKRAQVDGLDGYPVYTRKIYTDVSYLACAKKLLAASDAIYPQFATHNALTLASIYQLAGPDYTSAQYEFQCLHGMGEPLYDQVVGPLAQGKLDRPCRIYAPVGTHETLLAYLVRRLLENGANTSFVNRIGDSTVSIDALIADPVAESERVAPVGAPHPAIALPKSLYRDERVNSSGTGSVERSDSSRDSRAVSPKARRSRGQHGPAPRSDGTIGARRMCSTPPTGATASERWSRRMRRMSTPRCSARSSPRHAGDRRRSRNGRRASIAQRHCSTSACRCCSDSSCASRASPFPTPSAKCARRWTSCATTASRSGAISTMPRTCRWGPWRASAPGIFRWRSFSAR